MLYKYTRIKMVAMTDGIINALAFIAMSLFLDQTYIIISTVLLKQLSQAHYLFILIAFL